MAETGQRRRKGNRRDPARSVHLFPGEASELSPEGGTGVKVRGAKLTEGLCRQTRVQAVVLDLKGPRWNGLKQKGEQADLLSRKATRDSEF